MTEARSWRRCNACKGPNLTSINEDTGEVTPLFHPRTDVWEEHFRSESGFIHGLTPSGKATVRLLNMNAARRVQLRQLKTS